MSVLCCTEEIIIEVYFKQGVSFKMNKSSLKDKEKMHMHQSLYYYITAPATTGIAGICILY